MNDTPTITITTTDPEHDNDGYWSYEMSITVGEVEHLINCWKLATFLARGASQDIDGSGLQNWGSSQPGGWRVLDWDSQERGIPTVEAPTDEGTVTVSNTGDSIEIPIPEGTDPAEFAEALQEAITEAADANDPEEPDAEAIWNEMLSIYEMEYAPVRTGRIYGSQEVFVAYEMPGGVYESEKADAEDPPEELLDLVLEKFKEEYAYQVRKAEEDF